jgi:hypothetical protein
LPRQLDQLLLRGIEMSGSALRFTGAVRFCVGERLRSCAGERLRGAAREGLIEDHVWFEDRWMVASLCDE